MKGLTFLYDGWTVIAEFDASPTVPAAPSPRLVVSYVWGLDLSGTGGVGGEKIANTTATISFRCVNGTYQTTGKASVQ